MNPEDFKKQQKVQAVLVRNYVDTSKVDVEVIGDSVYIAGELHIFEYSPDAKKLKDPPRATPGDQEDLHDDRAGDSTRRRHFSHRVEAEELGEIRHELGEETGRLSPRGRILLLLSSQPSTC